MFSPLSLSRLHVNKTQPDRTPPVTGTHRSNARRPDEGRTGEERKENDRRPLPGEGGEFFLSSRFALGEACEARLPAFVVCVGVGCLCPKPRRGGPEPRGYGARERVLPRGGPRGLSLTSRLGRASARHPSAALPSARRTRKATPVKHKKNKRQSLRGEKNARPCAFCVGGMKPCRNPFLCKAQSHPLSVPCTISCELVPSFALWRVEIALWARTITCPTLSSRKSKMMTRCP